MAKRLAIVVDKFPSTSESFIAAEIRALQAFGHEIIVIPCSALWDGDGFLNSAPDEVVIHRSKFHIGRCAARLISFTLTHPFLFVRLLCTSLRCAKYSPKGLSVAAKAFQLAVDWRSLVDKHNIGHIHAHFLHLPALTARLLALLTHVTFSVSAHARDIFVSEVSAASICKHAQFICVCSTHGKQALLQQLFPKSRARVILICHGIDFREYPNPPPVSRSIVGDAKILTVCRLVEKKGVDTILYALSLLRQKGIYFSYHVVGDGNQLSNLRQVARDLGLDQVSFIGEATKLQVNAYYQSSDLFILGCRVSTDGDRDGIPNVILEAMASGLPVIATDCGGVREVITQDVTGYLVPTDNPAAMCEAILTIISDDKLRDRLRTTALAAIEEHFDISKNVTVLSRMLKSLTS